MVAPLRHGGPTVWATLVLLVWALSVVSPVVTKSMNRKVGEECSNKTNCHMYMKQGGGPIGFDNKVTCAVTMDAAMNCKRDGKFKGQCAFDGNLEIGEFGCECGVRKGNCLDKSPFEQVVDPFARYPH